MSKLRVVALAIGILAAHAEAQPAGDVPRVGFLNPLDRNAPHFQAFLQGLPELGYVDGRNIAVGARFAEGQYDRFPALIEDLVRAKVQVIAFTGAVTARAAMKAHTGVPLVFAVVVDPVADGVVGNLERPGADVTGTTSFDPQQARKQLELLREVLPGIERVAILGDQGVSQAPMNASEEQARALGLKPLRRRLTASPTS